MTPAGTGDAKPKRDWMYMLRLNPHERKLLKVVSERLDRDAAWVLRHGLELVAKEAKVPLPSKS